MFIFLGDMEEMEEMEEMGDMEEMEEMEEMIKEEEHIIILDYIPIKSIIVSVL